MSVTAKLQINCPAMPVYFRHAGLMQTAKEPCPGSMLTFPDGTVLPITLTLPECFVRRHWFLPVSEYAHPAPGARLTEFNDQTYLISPCAFFSPSLESRAKIGWMVDDFTCSGQCGSGTVFLDVPEEPVFGGFAQPVRATVGVNFPPEQECRYLEGYLAKWCGLSHLSSSQETFSSLLVPGGIGSGYVDFPLVGSHLEGLHPVEILVSADVLEGEVTFQ